LKLRDIGRGETITVVSTHESDHTRPGITMIGRPLPVGDVYRAFGGFLPAPRTLANPLIDAIDEGDADEMIELLASAFRPPQLRNTAGEELAFHTLSWEVDDPDGLHDALTAAGFHGDPDDAGKWRIAEDTTGMKEAIVATLRFDRDAGVLEAEMNSDERAAKVRSLVHEALPTARFVGDERRDLDEMRDEFGAGAGSGDSLDQNDPEVRRLLDEVIRAKEVEWLDLEIPALGGRTPREAVGDPIGREEVRQLLDSFPDPTPGGPNGFDPSRLRSLLGLDD